MAGFARIRWMGTADGFSRPVLYHFSLVTGFLSWASECGDTYLTSLLSPWRLDAHSHDADRQGNRAYHSPKISNAILLEFAQYCVSNS